MALTTAAVIGAGAAVAGAVSGRESAKEAGRVQEEAAEAGLQLAQEQFGEVRGELLPFIRGTTAERLFPPAGQFDEQTARLADLTAQRDELSQRLQTAGGLQVGGGAPFGGLAGVDQSGFQQLQDLNQQIQELESAVQDPLTGTQRAFGLQQAFTGALGPEAQAQAFQGFRESPGVQFLREQGLRSIETGAAARGGLGGGERLRELTRFSQGLALQDFGNQFNRLGAVTGTGLTAAQALGGVSGQATAAQTGLIGQAGQAQALGILGGQQATAKGTEQLVAQLPGLISAFQKPVAGT